MVLAEIQQQKIAKLKRKNLRVVRQLEDTLTLSRMEMDVRVDMELQPLAK
jgi:hypothetical protein